MSRGLVGQYVQLVVAPNTRKGVIKSEKVVNGRVELLFKQDPRFDGKVDDLWVLPSEVERCQRPTDSEVAAINRAAKYGSG